MCTVLYPQGWSACHCRVTRVPVRYVSCCFQGRACNCSPLHFPVLSTWSVDITLCREKKVHLQATRTARCIEAAMLPGVHTEGNHKICQHGLILG
jgi:hypothetical protein